MLVLTRKTNQRIRVTDTRTGEVLTITLARVEIGKARIGIDAGQEFRVERIDDENEENIQPPIDLPPNS